MQHIHPSSSHQRSFRLPVALLLSACFSLGAIAKDWAQWGGTNHRNMYSPQSGLPDQFDPGDFKPRSQEIDMATTKNVKWVAKLGTQSYGNVTIANGRVLVGTNNDAERDPQHQGDRSILKCFDEETGEFLWQLVVPKLRSGKVNDWEYLGLLSSPKVEGDRVYLVTSRCEVICLDLNGMANGNTGPFTDEASYVVQDTGNPPAEIGPKDADIIWVYDMMEELGVFPHNASNSSPLIIDDLVYVCTSNGQDWTHVNVPSPLSPSFIAVNKHTGEFAGEDDAGIGPRILHGQWSSPSSGEVNGGTQVFFGGGDGWLYAFEPKPVEEDDGEWLKTVWRYDANPPEYRTRNGQPIRYPAHDGPSEINSTPTFYNDRVYVAIGQDPEHGEGIGHLVCVDPTQEGDVTDTATIWSYKGIHRSISTVSIDPETNLLFVGDFSGFVHCLDADTGELHWTHDMKAHMWGSTLVADGKVYVGDEDGDLVVLAATKEKEVLSETNLNTPIYGTPVAANGVLYLQSNSHLFAFHDEAAAGESSDQGQPKVRIELGE
jgi:outer membrane protein assembly factor BamB